MSWDHRSANGRVHKNEGTTLTIVGVGLIILLLAIGLMGTSTFPYASFMGWGAAFFALIFAVAFGQFYALTPGDGRYDLQGSLMLLGAIAGTAIEYFYPEGQAFINSAYNYSFLGIVGAALLIIVFVVWAIMLFRAAENASVY